MATEIYKVILVGGGGVGKTTLTKRHHTGEFITKYEPTLGVEAHPLKFNTNYGLITLIIWDCAGQAKRAGLADGYYMEADGAIVMFDLTSSKTFQHVPCLLNTIHRVISDVPIVLCGNKVDLENRQVSPKQIYSFTHSPKQEGKITSYYDISAKSNYNFEKPFLTLLRHMSGHDDLIFIEMPVIAPPEIGDFSQEATEVSR